MGGVGLRPGRRHPDELQVGDAVDFLRVEALEEPSQLLRLRAEVKMPGRFWLQFEAQPLECGRTRLIQTIFFDPKGLLGLLYWHLFHPAHTLVFSGLIRAVAQQAEGRSARATPTASS
jgi:hypothetical protein